MKRQIQSGKGSAREALKAARPALVGAAVFSGAINVLMLSGPIFMLQVYDRVIPSRSLDTLGALVLLILLLHAAQSFMEGLRSRVFARVGRQFDDQLSPLVFAANIRRGLQGQFSARSAPFRDLEQLRGFLAGGGPSALFDLPWLPLYVLLLFMLHPLLGAFGLAGAAGLGSLAWLTDRSSRPLQLKAAALANEAASLAESARRNAETVAPLGMVKALSRNWMSKSQAAGAVVLTASDVSGHYSGWTRFLRLSMQSLVLAVGAWLVVLGEASGGVMIAASILLGRALSPVELAIVHWRGLVSARQAFDRLEKVLVHSEVVSNRSLRLPPPRSIIVAEGASIAAPGVNVPFVKGLRFELKAGDAMGVIGPSGSGKSTMARALVGIWPLASGVIRLDGSTLDQWPSQDAGDFIGYLPQSVELFPGTISENIGRFDPSADDRDILIAASEAGLDVVVRSMPDGFNTQVGEGGGLLSAGQRQRIALARALYRQPFFLVMDEPNSALDTEGEAALTQAIRSVRERGGVAVIIAHRPSALQACNKVLVLAEGQQRAFGPKEEVLKRVLSPVVTEAQAS